eukprot:m.45055 g.45055  ORF g.45055 m.45055 type:complete len:607 (+) comp14625_c0_seq1:849-2669(+)
MHAVRVENGQIVGHKIILHRGEGLHNVASLAAHIEVVQCATILEKVGILAGGALAHGGNRVGRGHNGAAHEAEDVAAVLEGASKLRRVDGQSQALVFRAHVHRGVLLHGRLNALAVVLVERRIDSVRVVVVRGNVVAHAHHAAEGLVGGTIGQGNVRQRPVEGVGLAVTAVAQVVDTAPGCLLADGRGNAVGGNHHPVAAIGRALRLIVELDAVVASGSVAAQSLRLDVVRLGAVKVAEVQAIGEDGNVAPGAGVPVGPVVALLGALVATTVVVGVLAGEDGRAVAQVVVAQVLVGGEEAAIALAAVALVVPLPRLMQAAVGGNVLPVAVEAVGLAASNVIVVGLVVLLAVGVEAITQKRSVGRQVQLLPRATAGSAVRLRSCLSCRATASAAVRAVVRVVDGGFAPLATGLQARDACANVHRRAARLNAGIAVHVPRDRPQALEIARLAGLLHAQHVVAAAFVQKVGQAHVLKHQLAVELVSITVLIAATAVLVCPFNGQNTAAVGIHGGVGAHEVRHVVLIVVAIQIVARVLEGLVRTVALVVATTIVVLAVKETVAVVAVGTSLVQAIVGAARHVQVQVAQAQVDQQARQNQEGGQHTNHGFD